MVAKVQQASLALEKMRWQLLFISCFTHLFGVNFLVSNSACANFVTFRKSACGNSDWQGSYKQGQHCIYLWHNIFQQGNINNHHSQENVLSSCRQFDYFFSKDDFFKVIVIYWKNLIKIYNRKKINMTTLQETRKRNEFKPLNKEAGLVVADI